VAAPNTNFVAIAAGYGHSLGLKSDGSIFGWGDNSYGQTDAPAPNSNFVAVAAGCNYSLGLKSDGSIVAWGDNGLGQCNVPDPNANFTAIAAGYSQALGLKSDGSIVAWPDPANVPSPNSGFVSVAAGYYHALGLKTDGSIVGWGNNDYGQTNVPVSNVNFGQQSGIVPSKGPVAGGTTVAILGSQLGSGADVTNMTLCGVMATIVTQSQSRIVVQTRSAAAPTNGDVAVYSVSRGKISRTNGFTYCALPTVVTLGATNITATSATGAGEVLSDGGDPACERGLCWGTTTNPTISDSIAVSGMGTGVFSVVMENLSPGALNHMRAWVTNAAGISYGLDVSLRTLYLVSASAGPHGRIVPNGTVSVEYGSNVTFTITNNAGYHITTLQVDGVPVGLTNNYTFYNLTTNHTIRAGFASDNGKWRFVALGDMAGVDLSSTGIVAEIVQAMVADTPDLFICTGDLRLDLGLVGFQQWTNAMAPLYQANIGVYPVRGNHDVADIAGWETVFNYLPANGPPGEVGLTYSVSNMNAVFIGLEQCITSKRVNQPWLDAQLAANTAEHVFVFSHRPAFPCGSHVGDSMDLYPANRDAFWSSLVAASARAYFCGHEHFYDHARIDNRDGIRANDVHQYVVGTSDEVFDTDAGYIGNNGSWIPVRQSHTNVYGYVLCEVNGREVTLTWKKRKSPGVYQAGESFVFADTYTVYGTPQSWLDQYGVTNDLSDTDHDGMPAWAEYRAGTDPTDPASCLLMNIGRSTTNAMISWSNTGSRTYRLWFRPSVATGSWQSVKAYVNSPAGTTTRYTNSIKTNTSFFRVTVVNTNL
jgi:hypothetical protein